MDKGIRFLLPVSDLVICPKSITSVMIGREKSLNILQDINISEDLMDLSIDCGIPVIVVVQSNREGARNEDLELENIRDSDGIAFNASLVFSVQQKDNMLQLAIKKSRNSATNIKLSYFWDIDTGRFEYVPSEDSNLDDTERSEELRRRYEVNEEEEY